MAPSHYLNQCWLRVIEVLWYSLETLILDMSLKITTLWLQSYLPGVNEMTLANYDCGLPIMRSLMFASILRLQTIHQTANLHPCQVYLGYFQEPHWLTPGNIQGNLTVLNLTVIWEAMTLMWLHCNITTKIAQTIALLNKTVLQY